MSRTTVNKMDIFAKNAIFKLSENLLNFFFRIKMWDFWNQNTEFRIFSRTKCLILLVHSIDAHHHFIVELIYVCHQQKKYLAIITCQIIHHELKGISFISFQNSFYLRPTTTALRTSFFIRMVIFFSRYAHIL